MKERIIVCELSEIQNTVQGWLDIGYNFSSIEEISTGAYLIILKKDKS